MAHSIVREETLTVKECPVCGVTYAIPERLSNNRREHGGSWFCPNGHSLVFTETTEQKLSAERGRREEAERRVQATRDLLHAEERSHAATRGHLTRTKKRVAHGVCPCCNRTFQQLSRHMKTKHPEYVEEFVPTAPTSPPRTDQ